MSGEVVTDVRSVGETQLEHFAAVQRKADERSRIEVDRGGVEDWILTYKFLC